MALAVGDEEQRARPVPRCYGNRWAWGTTPSTTCGSEGESGVEGRRSRWRSPGTAPASRRSSTARMGPEERRIGETATQFLGHVAASTPGRQGAPRPRVDPQLAPARGSTTAASSLAGRSRSSSLADRCPGPEAVDHEGGRLAERLLHGGEPDVHQPSSPASRSFGVHSSRRRATEHLPRGKPRDGVDNDDVSKMLVRRQRTGDELPKLIFPDRLAGIELHDGNRHFPGSLVDQSEHGTVQNRRVSVQDSLDLRRSDLEAVDLHHLLRAIGEVDPPLGLEPSDIARAIPAVGEGVGRRPLRGGTRPYRGAEHLDLADATGLEDAHRSRGRPHAVRRPLVATRRSRAATPLADRPDSPR